jgi:hypothetical protein
MIRGAVLPRLGDRLMHDSQYRLRVDAFDSFKAFGPSVFQLRRYVLDRRRSNQQVILAKT